MKHLTFFDCLLFSLLLPFLNVQPGEFHFFVCVELTDGLVLRWLLDDRSIVEH